MKIYLLIEWETNTSSLKEAVKEFEKKTGLKVLLGTPERIVKERPVNFPFPVPS